MNYDSRFAAVCGDARLPSYTALRQVPKNTNHPTQGVTGELNVGEMSTGGWDAAALRKLLLSQLPGDQVIVVSNRQPFSHETVNGAVALMQPASGLVTALEPVVRACNGTWIAHGSGDSDLEFVDTSGRCPAPDRDGTYQLRRIWLSDEEQKGYCAGFSNSGLWPLCHMVHVRPVFNQADWQHYRAVNAKFADAVVREARSPNPIVLVQDYHLALVPALVRALLPHATIVSFWHIPWPHPEQMGMCPWLPELLEGLLGSDIMGFQTPQHRHNFTNLARQCGMDVSADGLPAIVQTGHTTQLTQLTQVTQVRDYPISIAWPTAAESASLQSVTACRREAHARWSLPPHGKLILGVDRFDYTKGIMERLHAFEHLLDTQPQWQGAVRFVQVAAPTRTDLKDYADFQSQVRSEVTRINAKFSDTFTADGHAPVVLLDSHHDRTSLDTLYRAADVCLVTSLHDGMNLVCKEFVSARDDGRGVLVLSQFAGAVNELASALIVNPYHTAQVADALHQALRMPAAEQQQRMRALRATVKVANVYRWAATMLLDAAALRAPAPHRSVRPQLVPPRSRPASAGTPGEARMASV